VQRARLKLDPLLYNDVAGQFSAEDQVSGFDFSLDNTLGTDGEHFHRLDFPLEHAINPHAVRNGYGAFEHSAFADQRIESLILDLFQCDSFSGLIFSRRDKPERIYIFAVFYHFVVKMWRRGIAGITDKRNSLAAIDMLPLRN